MKRIFALLLAMALAMLCAGAMADTVTVDGINYELSGNSASVALYTAGKKYSGNVVIPAEIVHEGKTYRVTGINQYAFDRCTALASVTIPSSVKSIGADAFYDCEALKSVTIPDGVESIGKQAFLGCDSLTEVTIPSSVTVLGETVFRSCENLTTVTFAGAQPPDIKGKYLFNYCENLTTILVPEGSEATYEAALADQMRYFWLEEEQMSVEKRLLDGCKVVGFALPASLPRTGDSSSLALWIALLSAAGIGAFAMKRRAA